MSLHQENQIYQLEQKMYKLLERVGKLELEVKALKKAEAKKDFTINMHREDAGLPPIK